MTGEHDPLHDFSAGRADTDYDMAAEQDSGASENDYDLALPVDDGKAALKSKPSLKKSQRTHRGKRHDDSSDDSAYDLADDCSESNDNLGMDPDDGTSVESGFDNATGERVKVIKVTDTKYDTLVLGCGRRDLQSTVTLCPAEPKHSAGH